MDGRNVLMRYLAPHVGYKYLQKYPMQVDTRQVRSTASTRLSTHVPKYTSARICEIQIKSGGISPGILEDLDWQTDTLMHHVVGSTHVPYLYCT